MTYSIEEILEFEKTLDARAQSLVDKINNLCAPARERNKKKLESYANLVNLPLIGKLYHKKGPQGIEDEPTYTNTEWYKTESKSIEEDAEKLERRKHAHPKVFGDEKVTAGWWGDQGSVFETEREAVSLDYLYGRIRIFVPDKYDFSTAAGTDKTKKGLYVFDEATKKVVPAKGLQWSWTAGVGTRYTSKPEPVYYYYG
ncbi:MAG TPA: hypothetical protein VEC16_01870 [Alphaproteobacteria bacterium]|nr:hypothetical protein [Alphaproteobacteria bacterium]